MAFGLFGTSSDVPGSAASAEMLTRFDSAPIAAERGVPRRGLARLVRAGVIVTLLSGGWFAYHAMELHVPLSLVEALMPRLQQLPSPQRVALFNARRISSFIG